MSHLKIRKVDTFEKITVMEISCTLGVTQTATSLPKIVTLEVLELTPINLARRKKIKNWGVPIRYPTSPNNSRCTVGALSHGTANITQ
jgi:hypothetical protein